MFTDAHRECDIHANADGNCYDYGNSKLYAYTQCYTNSYSSHYAYGYCNLNCNSHCNSYSNRDSHCHCHGQANADCQTPPNAEAASYSRAAPVREP